MWLLAVLEKLLKPFSMSQSIRQKKDTSDPLDSSSQIQSTLNYINQTWITSISSFTLTGSKLSSLAWGAATAGLKTMTNDWKRRRKLDTASKRYRSWKFNKSSYARLSACSEKDPLMDFPAAWLLFCLIRLPHSHHSVILPVLHATSLRRYATTIRPRSILPIKCNRTCIYREDLKVTVRQQDS